MRLQDFQRKSVGEILNIESCAAAVTPKKVKTKQDAPGSSAKD